MKKTMKEYAHLKAEEKEIARRWTDLVPIQGRREWDVHLEVPLPELPAWWTKRDIERYSFSRHKRIDLVVHGFEYIWIMEITPLLSKPAIGGCQVYQDLYIKQFKPEKPVKLGIIVEVDDPAYHDTLKKLNIELWVV